ncbi:MAG: hypothetical protein H6696_05700 [Deferribacteres bacterium]|nr:hypothetical protein [Deferribacteres bacterium]
MGIFISYSLFCTFLKRSFFYVIVFPVLGFTQTKIETIQLSGTIENINSNILTIDGEKFFIRPNSKIYSQAFPKASINHVHQGVMVDASYYNLGQIHVIQKLKVLDMVGSGNYQTFMGKITKIKPNEVYIGTQNFVIDDFTIKIGLKLQKSNVNFWRGSYVTVTALQNNAGQWIAEIIREGITPDPALTGSFTE